MSIGIRCTAPEAWTVYLSATLSVQGNYYVASRTIQPGQVLDESTLTPRVGELLTLPPGAVLSLSSIHGQVAGQRISAGKVVRASALRSADAVQRGQAVR